MIMSLSWLIGSLHVLTLGIGFGACWMRARTLRNVKTRGDLGEVFYADNLYGTATLLWIGTGLWRAFGGLEKGTDHYLQSTAFGLKMTAFGLVFLLELYPMIKLIRWRIDLKKGREPDVARTALMAKLTYAELAGLAIMVMLATAMARGY
jgi:putative membrane protein